MSAVAIYFAIIAILFALFVYAAAIHAEEQIPGKSRDKLLLLYESEEEDKEKYEKAFEEETRNLLEDERNWAKALAAYNPLLLAACLAYFFTYQQNQLYANIKILVCLIAFASVISMSFAVLFWLSSFFCRSWDMGYQKPSPLHKFLAAANSLLMSNWHLFPFCFTLAQAVLAGAVIVSITFHTPEQISPAHTDTPSHLDSHQPPTSEEKP